ncbi:MAG: glycosyltransferase [Pedobacter sp.]|nr:MAG: glycosyltransferase [Pedobacter sp.]
MKISIITVVYNGQLFLEDCIQSVISQSYKNIEYIIIDGGSTDKTLPIIDKYKAFISNSLSESDQGLYDAINKGIKLASGNVIGLLNSDDMFAANNVISEIASAFIENSKIDAVHGDLHYVTSSQGIVMRVWKSKQASFKDVANGWMPAHPTLYIKKDIIERYGNYAIDLGSASDYDFILRYFYVNRLNALYIPKLMVNMRLGGVSNRNLVSLLSAIKNDYNALKRNKVKYPISVLIKKKLSKFFQFWNALIDHPHKQRS